MRAHNKYTQIFYFITMPNDVEMHSARSVMPGTDEWQHVLCKFMYINY